MPESHTVEHPAELLPFLFACRPEVKRTKVRQWLKHGSVQVNGLSVTRSNHPLQTGDVVSIRSKGQVQAEVLLPLKMPLLFEDASLIVVEKPANLLSMASDSERRQDSLLVPDALRAPRQPSQPGAGVDRPPVGP